MEHNTHIMTKEELQRAAYITHINEAAAKDQDINTMLTLFYKQICVVAECKGIQLSKLQIPTYFEEQQSIDVNNNQQNNSFQNTTT